MVNHGRQHHVEHEVMSDVHVPHNRKRLFLRPCQECQQDLGTKKFNETALKNYKYHGCKRLICTACTDISEVTTIKHRKEEESQAGERACPANEESQ